MKPADMTDELPADEGVKAVFSCGLKCGMCQHFRHTAIVEADGAKRPCAALGRDSHQPPCPKFSPNAYAFLSESPKIRSDFLKLFKLVHTTGSSQEQRQLTLENIAMWVANAISANKAGTPLGVPVLVDGKPRGELLVHATRSGQAKILQPDGTTLTVEGRTVTKDTAAIKELKKAEAAALAEKVKAPKKKAAGKAKDKKAAASKKDKAPAKTAKKPSAKKPAAKKPAAKKPAARKAAPKAKAKAPAKKKPAAKKK